SNVKLIVYDIQGKQKTELVNQKQTAGTYEVDFSGSNYSSGVYFYKLIVNSGKEVFTDTKKMVLIK
ncbi:MAG: T9SS type A sorting domain-containing protein, partial [Ignavibacteria bacterium]|nr:T9SS type A sorting domain-containing protein [Ignavibacteria bacterium]